MLSPTLPPSNETPSYGGLGLIPHPDSKGTSHGASREERKRTVFGTLSLGLSISFWMLQCRLTQACCLQIKEPDCLAELAVSSHELHIFTNRETYLVKRNHEAASEVAAGHRSVREARGLGNYLAVAASKCGRGAWVWSSKQHWKEACGLCHVTVETPARAK